MANVGLDLGTNLLVSAKINEEGHVDFKSQRDAYYTLVPKTEVNRNSMRTSLEKVGANFIVDDIGSFTVVGQDALEIAIERNDVARRPLKKGIISPKEKAALPMLKIIIEELVGRGEEGNKLIYSVPAKPIDSDFDIIYHQEIMGMYISELGYESQPLNESFAIALSELLDDNLTGITMSFGAGMINVAVIHQGDPLVEFSITRGGDYIDNSVGMMLDISPSLVQLEKEAGTNLLKPTTKIMEAVAVYYNAVVKYALKNIAYELSEREKTLPVFRDAVPIIVSGGLTMAEGFVDVFKDTFKKIDFPIKIKDVRKAKSPTTAVANGCLLATQI